MDAMDLPRHFAERERHHRVHDPFDAAELGVADAVTFVHGDAAGYVVDVASCLGVTWIGGGLDGTIERLRRSARPGGMLLVASRTGAANPTTRRWRASG